MQRLLKTTILLLLAIWLPATLHCNLEAAGFAVSHHADGSSTGHDCKTDACASIESSLIRQTAPALNLIAPATGDSFLFLCCLVDLTGARSAASTLELCRLSPPLEIETSWQFLTRAAPPSRAPSSNA